MTTQQQYEILRNELNEQQWRLYLGTEALKIGSGGISQVAARAGADWKAVQRGVKELTGERVRAQGRIRQAGGGRKKAAVTDPSLQGDLEALLEPKGDPMSLIKWTTHSLTQLVKALSRQGHRIKRTALADLLHEQGYSLKVNKKTLEGTSHADRDQQFGHITALCQQFEQKQAPAISVDCKKKELLGTWVSIRRRRNLRWRVSGGGGSTAAKGCIRRRRNCSSPPMGAAAMVCATSCGRRPCKPWPLKNSSRSPWRIIPLRRASGTRSNTASFLSFPSIGGPNRSRLWKR